MSVRANVRVCARAPTSVSLRPYNVFLFIINLEYVYCIKENISTSLLSSLNIKGTVQSNITYTKKEDTFYVVIIFQSFSIHVNELQCGIIFLISTYNCTIRTCKNQVLNITNLAHVAGVNDVF